jgi:hypothetical protein
MEASGSGAVEAGKIAPFGAEKRGVERFFMGISQL